jgi:hypothetical protein
MTELELEWATRENEMKEEALLLLRSFTWTEKQIEVKDRELEEARLRFDYDGEETISKELVTLYRKLSIEVGNMERFMQRHSEVILKEFTKINNEKEKSLFDSWKEKQVYLRSVPKNERG